MARSLDAIVYAGVAPVKVAEVDISFFRLPGATDEELKQGSIDTCNEAFLEQGQANLAAINPRIKKVNAFSWMSTVDVIESGTTVARMPPVRGIDPVTWGLIAYLIAGILIGWLVTKWIIYWIRIRPMQQDIQEVISTLDTIIAEKHDRLAAGYITQEYADELDAMLEQARDDAEDAGEDPQLTWLDYLGKFLEWGKYIPWIVGGAIVLAVLSTVRAFAPRR